MTLRAFLFFAVVLLTTPFSQNAFAENAQIGTIIEVEGTGTIKSDTGAVNNAATIKLSSTHNVFPVYMNDIIETDAASKAHILFIDDTELTLGENARLQVDEYIFDPDNMDINTGRFSITRGAFLFVSGLITKISKPDVQVNTAYGTIGIRGTEFWGGDIDEEYGILVQDGEITVQTDRGRIQVGAGQGTSIRSRNSIPSRAKTWSPDKIERAQNKIALKRREAVLRRVAEQKEKHQILRAKYKENLKQRLQRNKELQQQKQDQNRYQKQKRIEKRGDIEPQKQEEKKAERPKSLQEKRKEIVETRRENAENLPAARSEEAMEKMHLKQEQRREVQKRNNGF